VSTRRKISVRKIIQTLVTLVVVSGCTLAMLSADRQQNNHLIKDVQLRVLNTNHVHFLTDDMVYNMLFTARHIEPRKLTTANVDERSMEAILNANPWVSKAQVYTDNERVMHISVSQRIPVVRLFEEDGNSYYLDTALKSMPLSKDYTHYTPVMTGVPVLSNDSISNSKKGEIVGLVQWVSRHPFWNAQISQISMRADGGFELIPVLGKQRIILGDTSRLEDKLDNLFAFYKQVQNNIGWDKYSTIDLRYEGQIVSSPKLPWKAPASNALSNMDWVTTILESAPSHQDQLGGDATAYADSVSKNDMPKVPVTPAVKTNATIPPTPVKKPNTIHAPVNPAKTPHAVTTAKVKVHPNQVPKKKTPTNNSRPEKNKKTNAAPKH
jgi:cell division protein FtsQ